ENAIKGFTRMGNALLNRCELDPTLRELAILRVGRLSRAAYEVFQHERIAREARVAEEKIAALRDATIEAPAFTDNERAVLRFTDDVVRNIKASDRSLKAVQAFLTPGALVELTLTVGYYMMVCRFLETLGVDGEDGQAEWLKTAKL
ncbi:MAG: carboxymuconolactone decarboxylase family protein, partial [Solimonas sp.]